VPPGGAACHLPRVSASPGLDILNESSAMAQPPSSREDKLRDDKSREDKEHQRVMRDLRQQGQAALTWGLPNPATEVAVLGMGLVLRDRLAAVDRSERAAEAAEFASTMLDKTVQRMPQSPSIECTKGCSFCCHGSVSVSAPEVFRIVRVLEAGAENRRADVLTRARARSASTYEAVISLRDPCPLLIESDCSVYLERPMGCRQFVSTNRAGCRTAFERGSSELPFVPGAANAGLVVRSLLLGAAASLGLKADTYDLSSALATALSEPDAERRWLAGEDPLSAAMKAPQPPNMQGGVQRWSQMLKGLHE
jgi:hypothetical protein